MSKHLTGVMVAVFTATVLLTAPAFADHRPGNVVVMGGTLALTGRLAGGGGGRRAYNGRKLFVDELNARGGLLGHKVELRILDDKSDIQTAIRLYERLITEDKVDIVVGPYSSHLTDPVANVMERYKRPFVPQAGADFIWQRGRRYIFGMPNPSAGDGQKGALHLAKKVGIRRIAIITLTERYLRATLAGALEWAKKLGLKVALVERYPPGQTDFRALLQKIEASHAEAIFSNSRFLDAVAQLRQLRELNINVKMFSSTIGPASPKFVKELGDTAEYVLGRATWLPKPVLGHPGLKQFVDKYENRHGVTPNYHAANGYVVMQMIAAAVTGAGSLDPEKVRDALASMTIYTIKGPYKANEQGRSPTIEHLTFQIQNGKRIIVWPAHQAQAKVLPMPKWEDRAKK